MSTSRIGFEFISDDKFVLLLFVTSPGQDDWNGTQRTGKVPPTSRGAKTSYRQHPYRQYWSRLVTFNVSPRVPPVYHGSSRFKQPHKSNCPFCLWFGLFLHRTLYDRTNWELKIGTDFWVLTANSLPPSLLCHTNHPPIHPTNQPKRLLDGLEMRSWRPFFVLFHLSFCLFLLYFFPLTLFTPLWLFLQCWSLIFFNCLEVVISSGSSGSLPTCLRNPF